MKTNQLYVQPLRNRTFLYWNLMNLLESKLFLCVVY